jgi:hypothetical protein
VSEDGIATPADSASALQQEGWEWAIVEIFGHRRHAGRIREEERFGAKMLRIDVPTDGDPAKGWETRYYGGSSIFSLSLSDEPTVMKANRPYDSPYRLTVAAAPSVPDEGVATPQDGEPL